jgi:streptogramin lyase
MQMVRNPLRHGRSELRPIVSVCLILTLALAACGGSAPATSPSGLAVGGAPSAPGSPASELSSPETATQPVSPSSSVNATALPDGVLASIPLRAGDAPSAIAIGYGSVWVETHRGTTLDRIDPASDEVSASIDVGQQSCGSPGIGFGRVWVTSCGDSAQTVVVDPATNQVVGSFEGGGLSMVFTKDALWVPDHATGHLLEIDPTTYKVRKDLGPSRTGAAAFVLASAGFIWVVEIAGEHLGGTFAKVDPATGNVVSRLTVADPGAFTYVTADFGHLWLKSSDNDRLVRVDPTSGDVTTFAIPGFVALPEFYDIFPATGLGSLWLRMSAGTVSRVDPTTGKVTGTYPADEAGGGGYPAVGFGSLWVANFSTDTIWRDRITP